MFRIAGLAVLAEATEELVEELDGVWWDLGLAPVPISDDELCDSSFGLGDGEEEEEADASSRGSAVAQVSELDEEIESLRSDIEECIRARINKFSRRLEALRREMADVADHCRTNCALLQLPEGLVDQIVNSTDSSLSLTTKIEKLKDLEGELEEQLEKRRAHALLLKERLRDLCSQLGKEPEDMFPDVFGPGAASDVSLQRVHQLQVAMATADAALEEARQEVAAMKADVTRLYELLEYTDEERQNWLDSFIASDALTPTDAEGNILSLEETKRLLRARKEELQGEYDRLFTAVQTLMPKIAALWDELEIDDGSDPHCIRLWAELLGDELADDADARDDFLRHVRETRRYSERAIALCEEELERLASIRNDRYRDLVDMERGALEELWDKLHMGEAERRRFLPGFCEENSQDVLKACRREILRLERLYEELEPLLKRIERREWIKEQMMVFEQVASDPNRFKGNSARLLQEEKFRKIVSKEFPRLTEELRETLEWWYEDHGGEAFYYDGEPYLETMEAELIDPSFELLHLRLHSGRKRQRRGNGMGAELRGPDQVHDRQSRTTSGAHHRRARSHGL